MGITTPGGLRPLKRHYRVRFAYLDESGIGKVEIEPYTVVAGVIVHADRQWKSLESYLCDMIIEFIPEEKRLGFTFHATELFSGGRNMHRDIFRKELRWHILDELCQLPNKFDLPIVCGIWDRRIEPELISLKKVKKL
jgi:hypothetical protein